MKVTTNHSSVTQVTGVNRNKINDLHATASTNPGVSQVPAKRASRFPNAEDRPCFVVIEEDFSTPSKKYKAGVWNCFMKKGGQIDGEDTPIEQWICSPLYIDAVTTDAMDRNYGRLLRFRNTNGHWKTWAMPMALLKGEGADIREVLLSMGVEISSRSRLIVNSYLSENTPKNRLQCHTQTGWTGMDHAAFVLPDTVIGPMAKGIVYQSDAPLEQDYRITGTLGGWQRGVSALAVGNPMLAISLCAAFCGPLLSLCHEESGGIHLIGDSSSGKTTALLAACSVWGGPSYRRSWRATSNGLEGVAALFNDTLLALDEISECDPRAISEIVYMLGNGRGKQRANKYGSARSVAQWRTSVLSTGERSISTSMDEGGHRIKAGQTVRILDIPVGSAYGAWDSLHQYENGQRFSDALKQQSSMHFGHAGRHYLEHLASAPNSQYASRIEAIKSELATNQGRRGGQVERALSRLATLALAGELATEFGITQWPKGEATRAARVCFKAWIDMRGSDLGNSEETQIIESINAFIDRHGDSRFSCISGAESTYSITTRDRAGYWSDNNGERIYFFNRTGMREALRGFDYKRALVVLHNAGMLEAPDAEGKHARVKRVKGVPTRLYRLNLNGESKPDQHPPKRGTVSSAF